MTELITWLERQIELCDDLKNMEKEKWAFIQTLKKVRKEAINYTHSCTELKVFKKGDPVVVDGCLDAEIVLKNEPTYRVKYIDDQDFGEVGINGLEMKNP